MRHVADSWVSRGRCGAHINPHPDPMAFLRVVRAAASVSPLISLKTHIHRSALTCQGRGNEFHVIGMCT